MAELTGIAAIVASLIFVGIQLKQDQVIARSELTSRSFELIIELDRLLLSPDIASTFAKMLDRPEELSRQELVQLDSLLRTVKTMYERECYLKSRGIFVECDEIAKGTVEKFFGNSYGRSWWQRNKYQYDYEDLGSVPDWIDAEIESLDPSSYPQKIENEAGSN